LSGIPAALGDGLTGGRLIAYLGPETLLLGGAANVPATPRELADALTMKVAVPGRIRGNVWSVAQYIESRRHRKTLAKLMTDIFVGTPPGPLHAWLAKLDPPLIVDAWYDDAMSAALTGDWGQIQAVTRNGRNEDVWHRALRADGTDAAPGEAGLWTTILYKPHGAVKPHGEFLLSDSDYVEVLTEIDIQTPIPAEVVARRRARGFVFFGCRFADQTARIFARQILKRSAGPHYAFIADEPTNKERRFLEEMAITPIAMPLAEAVSELTR
jgi:hypothetical protein